MGPAQPGFWSMDKNDDAYRTISEAAEELDLPQHVLRFWETRFPQIKPMKRGGGRRYYRPEDLELLRAIRDLLYGEGYTIKGVQRLLTEQGPRQVAALAAGGQSGGANVSVLSAQEGLSLKDLPPEESSPEEASQEDLSASFGGPAARPVLTATRDFPRNAARDTQPAPSHPQGAYLTQGSYLGKTDLHALESALADLEECKRILENAQT
jgi:DNA-binding transcriptional MerR regulator